MLRQLRRHRAFAGTLIAVLAIGVAVTTAMFSIVYGVLIRELPYPGADRLVTLSSTYPRMPQGRIVAGAAAGRPRVNITCASPSSTEQKSSCPSLPTTPIMCVKPRVST